MTTRSSGTTLQRRQRLTAAVIERMKAITTCVVCGERIVRQADGLWLDEKKAMIHKTCKC